MPWWLKVSLETIVAPFSGFSQSLDETLLLKGKANLCTLAGLPKKFRLKMSSPRFLNIQSASPNGSVSLEASYKDALAFIRYPKTLLAVLVWNCFNKGWLININLLTLILMGIPYEFSNLLFGRWRDSPFGKLHLGKLSIVKDVAGKSRVVGITNYWIQVSLKPLHDSILELLKKVPTDGTFGQEEVINRLSQTSKAKFSSFDLSAATDRLPLRVQEDILSLFIGRKMAYLWGCILNIPFYYKGEMVTGEVDACIGPKLILASIHCKLLKVTILHDSYKRRILDKSGLLEKLNWGPSSKEGAFSFGHYLLFRPWGLIEKDQNVALTSGIIKHQFYHDLSAVKSFLACMRRLAKYCLRGDEIIGMLFCDPFVLFQ